MQIDGNRARDEVFTEIDSILSQLQNKKQKGTGLGITFQFIIQGLFYYLFSP